MRSPRSTCCFQVQFRLFFLYWRCTNSPPELRKVGVGHLTPGSSPILCPFLASRFGVPWPGHCISPPCKLRKGLWVAVCLCSFPQEGGLQGALRGHRQWEWGVICRLAPTPSLKLLLWGCCQPRLEGQRRHRAPCRHHQLQLTGGLGWGGTSCLGSWQDLPPCSPSAGGPRLLEAGSGQCCPISYLWSWK